MAQADSHAYIVSLLLAEPLATTLTALRRRHFPPARNVLPAHVTLFHALPGEVRARVAATLAAEAGAMTRCPVRLDKVVSLGRGVALRLHAPPVAALHARLAQAFAGHLTRQDSQPFWPHVTVQNKVDGALARQTRATLAASLPLPLTGEATGLALWRYVGGPWQAEGTFAFGERT